MKEIVFITASHSRDILENNLLMSKVLDKYPLHIMQGYKNIPKAYNRATIDGINIYVHNDVFLPDNFEENLLKSLDAINRTDSDWGVLGVAGVIATPDNKKASYGSLLDRGMDWDGIKEIPHEVDTLDELMLITKGDLIFDDNIPSAHFYGCDICLQSTLLGRKNYVVNAYCHHNSDLPQEGRPDGFLEARDYIKEKYKDYLPIATTCTVIPLPTSAMRFIPRGRARRRRPE